MEGAHFEVFKDKAGTYRFRLVAANGEIVCQSEGYGSLDNAERGARGLILVIQTTVKTVDDQRSIDIRRVAT